MVKTGNYFAIGSKLQTIASEQAGKLDVIETKGSVDNIRRLISDINLGKNNSFAMVQSGLSWSDSENLEIVARFPVSEGVFLVGRNAENFRYLSDLKGIELGVGPKGSGSSDLAKKLFGSEQLSALNVEIINKENDKQISALKNGSLDLALYVINPNSTLLKSFLDMGLSIAPLEHLESIAKKLPFLNIETLHAGYFDPITLRPARDLKVLTLPTVLLASKKAKRSDVVSILTTIQRTMPEVIKSSHTLSNQTDFRVSNYAQEFFKNNGPTLWDEYIPMIIDYIPIGNVFQSVMVISILFNLMGAAHRFRLWRLDAERINLEVRLKNLLNKKPSQDASESEKKILVQDLKKLKEKCHKSSLSIIVPMGKEMSYRYQEELLKSHIDQLEAS